MIEDAGSSRPQARAGGFVVVQELSGPVRRHRVLRSAATGCGVLLLLLAYVALLPAMLVGTVAVLAVILEGRLERPEPGSELQIVLLVLASVAAAVILWRFGVLLVRGHRHLALFLRKFGFTQATEAVSVAIGSGLGRRWRLVTLDDHDVAPMGVSGRSRWTARLSRLLLVAGAVIAGTAAVRYLTGEGLQRMLAGIAASAFEDARAQGQNELTAAVGAMFVAVIVGILAMLFVVALWSLLISLLAAGGVLMSIVCRSARRAERAKALTVTTSAQLTRVARRIDRLSHRVLAPRVTVARVADRLWQDLVRLLATASDVVLVDVSYPTDNLLWEIRSLQVLGVRWLPIGQADRLELLSDDPTPTAVQVRSLLAGREVIGYRFDVIDAFMHGLRHSLDVLATRR